MNINKEYKIIRPKDFKLEHIFQCGQAFRWKEEIDGSYTIIAFSKVLNILENENELIFRNSDEDDFNNIWKDYFDLDTDYSLIKENISIDNTMKEAIDFGYGIRILNQDIFETIITFIISANNRIPQIMKSVNLIAETYGKSLGDGYYSFPTPYDLAIQDPNELKEICRVGFRNERIIKASKMISDGFLDGNWINEYSTDEVEKKLQELPGVGPKVASCISLFAMGRGDSFPVDVWIKRVMENLYFKEEVSKNKITSQSRKNFGDNCGYAQQYLFYYGRENEIGK